MSGKGHGNVRNLWLWQPYTFLVLVFHFEVVTITFFLIVIVLFCLAFSFFVIVFFAFLVERCRNVSQGDDVAAALNWSSELLYSRWVFSPVTNHITIHTFGFFLEGFSTWGKRPLLELSFGLFQVNVTGIEVSLVVRYCVVVKTDILFSITKSARNAFQRLFSTWFVVSSVKPLSTFYVIILKECIWINRPPLLWNMPEVTHAIKHVSYWKLNKYVVLLTNNYVCLKWTQVYL